MKRVFLSYSYDHDRHLVESLKLRMREAASSFEVFDPMDLSVDYDLASYVGLQIKRASIVIAFLNAVNVNVIYETGMAIGAGKTVLIVGQELESLPAELRLVPFVSVSGDVEADVTSIVDRLQALRSEEERPLSHYTTSQEKLQTYSSDPDYFDAMSPPEFEELLIEWFRDSGFVVEPSSRPSQYGVDVLLKSPYDRSIIVVEMKKFSRQSRVSIKDVMALFGAATLFEADKAVLITSSSFTAAALEMAKTSSEPKLYLLTMSDLLKTSDPALLLK